MIRTMLQVFLSMNYKKHRGTAHGLMFGGATASSFVFPTVLLALKEAYSTRGCMLIEGAILLHLLPLCMLMNKRDCDDVHKKPTANSDDVNIQAMEKREKPETSGGPCSAIASDAAQILRIPMFYVIVTSWLIVGCTIEVFYMTIVDFAMDRGLSANNVVTLLAGYAVTDLCGRICLPMASDREYVRTSTLMAVNYLFLGASVLALPEVWSYVGLLAVGASVAVFVGCGLAMHGVLMAKYIGLERLPLSYAIAGFLSGPMFFLKPVVIGYYRDNIGSYNNLYRLLGGLLLSLCAPWSATMLWERRENKRTRAYGSRNNHELSEKSALSCQNIAEDSLNS
ncbi:unnamed protein product [Ixodes hexagonus]